MHHTVFLVVRGMTIWTQHQLLSRSINPGGDILLLARDPENTLLSLRHSVHGMLQVCAVHTVI